MDEAIERRVADERHRALLSERLTAIETSQKLYHNEMKSIIEGLHKEIASAKSDLATLRWTLYGGPNHNDVGLLERFRLLLWKFTAITTVGFGMVTGGLKLLGPTINRAGMKLIGEDDVMQMVQQSTKKRMQLFNRTTGKYEYFIEYKPIQQKQTGQKVDNP
jgi:hypothetical protein